MNATTNRAFIPQPLIRVTPMNVSLGEDSEQLILPTFELIAYCQDLESTRLHLTRRRVIEVKETTQQIDLLVRAAAQATVSAVPVAAGLDPIIGPEASDYPASAA